MQHKFEFYYSHGTVGFFYDIDHHTGEHEWSTFSSNPCKMSERKKKLKRESEVKFRNQWTTSTLWCRLTLNHQKKIISFLLLRMQFLIHKSHVESDDMRCRATKITLQFFFFFWIIIIIKMNLIDNTNRCLGSRSIYTREPSIQSSVATINMRIIF